MKWLEIIVLIVRQAFVNSFWDTRVSMDIPIIFVINVTKRMVVLRKHTKHSMKECLIDVEFVLRSTSTKLILENMYL